MPSKKPKIKVQEPSITETQDIVLSVVLALIVGIITAIVIGLYYKDPSSVDIHYKDLL